MSPSPSTSAENTDTAELQSATNCAAPNPPFAASADTIVTW